MKTDQPALTAPEGLKRLGRMTLNSGALVKHQSEAFRIQEVLNFDEVLGVSLMSGRPTLLRIADLQPVDDAQDIPSAADLQAIGEDDWREAKERYDAIKPLLDKGTPTRAEVVARAAEVGRDVTTLYRWLKRYKNFEQLSALISTKRGWREGNYRLSPAVDKVIREVLEGYYLTTTRPSIVKTVTDIKIKCLALRIAPPSHTAIRARIDKIPAFERMKRRGRLEKAKNIYQPVPGHFPGGDFPLDVVQIDHTPIDLIIVDERSRRPIDRAWLTIAIDIFSRMVVGYYLSLDAPSVTSVAMCIAHAMLPKDEWLLKHGLDSSQWPVWGKPRKIHVDNGPDFRSHDLRRSCDQHGIDLEFRPVKVPRYGGHVERLQGTLLRELHDLPGTTFSSIVHREGYNSEANAALTLEDLELQLLKLIVDEYHRRPHSVIGMPPLRKWEQGIFGQGSTPARGLPPRPVDSLSVLLDFMPSFQRTIQADGVTLDGLSYYDECLRPWIGLIDPETQKGRLHLFRRDPRNATEIYFFDPDLKRYCRVPHSDLALTQFSVWEHKAAKAAIKASGNDPSDELAVLRSVAERRELAQQAVGKTKKARREAERRRVHAKGVNPAHPKSESEAPTYTASPARKKINVRADTAPDEYQALGLLSDLPPLGDDE